VDEDTIPGVQALPWNLANAFEHAGLRPDSVIGCLRGLDEGDGSDTEYRDHEGCCQPKQL